jgi:hypothetical protein
MTIDEFREKSILEKLAIIDSDAIYHRSIKSKKKYESPTFIYSLFDFWVFEYTTRRGLGSRRIYAAETRSLFWKDFDREKIRDWIALSIAIILFMIIPACAVISALNKGISGEAEFENYCIDFVVSSLSWIGIVINFTVKWLWAAIFPGILFFIVAYPLYLLYSLIKKIVRRNKVENI